MSRCIIVLVLVSILLSNRMQAQEKDTQRVYFGTYTGRGSEGIYLADQNLVTGKLSEPRLAAKVINPSFLAVHPSKKYLYTVSEVETTDGKKGGGVSAFRIDLDGTLSKINSQVTIGGAPCHLSIDHTGKCVMVANYSGGSVSALPIKEDGSLGVVTSFTKHTGKSIDPRRQEAPHAHSINVDAKNQYAFVADLGIDEIRIYQLDAGKATLTPHNAAKTPAGGGPRHFAFHPNGKFAYTNNEMTSSVTSFSYDAEKGTLTTLDTVSSLPTPTPGNSTAEIRVHPNGKFVYVSNRGHNSIAIFHVKDDGTLTPQGHVSTQGKTPRNFGMDENYVLAANQDTGNIVVFRIDQQTGGLSPVGSMIKVSMPVCVIMVK